MKFYFAFRLFYKVGEKYILINKVWFLKSHFSTDLCYWEHFLSVVSIPIYMAINLGIRVGLLLRQFKFADVLCVSHRNGMTFVQKFYKPHKSRNFYPIVTKFSILLWYVYIVKIAYLGKILAMWIPHSLSVDTLSFATL